MNVVIINGSPRPKHKSMRAAKRLISEKGFENISIDEIAREAGVSTGSFYTYFKRKEDVVEALNQTDFCRLAEIVNGMTDTDILERLRCYCKGFLKGIEDTGNLSFLAVNAGHTTREVEKTPGYPRTRRSAYHVLCPPTGAFIGVCRCPLHMEDVSFR